MTDKQYLNLMIHFNNNLSTEVYLEVHEGSTIDQAWDNLLNWNQNAVIKVDKNDKFPGCIFKLNDVILIKRIN